jgi:predicted RNA-binding protein YlqC (UPF0109 family)
MATPVEMTLSICKTLAFKPEALAARWVEAAPNGHVEVNAAPEDRGKIIGRRGRTIQSLRQAVTAVFGRNGGRIGVELAEQ